MGGGLIQMEPVKFSVPGAAITLNGSYQIEGERLDFRGTAKTDAKISEMTTDVKSIFLKAIDPIFKRKDAGAVIPLAIGGTRDKPSFGFAIGKAKTSSDADRKKK